ncbi:MAG: hypothetical protein ABH804_01560 [archaeon]
MNVKTKKQNDDGIVRLETSGEIKEILIKEDFLNADSASIAICFRGNNGSGIVELTPREVDDLYKKILPKFPLMGNVKVMKFKK